MVKLTQKGREALEVILEVKPYGFTAKELSQRSGVKVTAQALNGLVTRGILCKIEKTAPVEFRILIQFDEIAKILAGDTSVKLVSNISKDNRYSSYKTLIQKKVLDNVVDVKDYEYMFTLMGSYIEQTIYDTRGINYPKTKPFMLSKKVDDPEAFQKAWEDLCDYNLIIL